MEGTKSNNDNREYTIKDGITFNGKCKFYKEQIICPKCLNICNAEVEVSDFPFASYVHFCEHCGYVIMESEWETIKDNE